MSSLDRLFLFAIAIVTGVIGLLVALSMWGAIDRLILLLEYLFAEAKTETIVLSLAMIAASFYLIAIAMRTRRLYRSIVRDTALGNVRISIKTIESLVLRAARQVKGVREVLAVVQADAGGVKIDVDMEVAPDLSIPDIAADVQRQVEEYIQNTVGIAVPEVRVHVRGLAGEGKARVE